MNESRKGWRRGVALLYIAVWQLLRGGAAILLLVLFVPVLVFFYYKTYNLAYNTENTPDASKVRQERDPGLVCGILSSTIVEFPREYIIFWPEYEGKSSWEVGFTSNAKGCGAKLVSLHMAASWPDFQPLRSSEYFVSGSNGSRWQKFSFLEIALSPLVRKTDNMQYRLDRFFSHRKNLSAIYQNKHYAESLGLFFVDSNDAVVSDVINRYFWSEDDGAIPVVFECYRRRKSTDIYGCTGYFLMKEFDYFVELEFPYGALRIWREIVEKTKIFILTKINK